jgi:hypothetical protein
LKIIVPEKLSDLLELSLNDLDLVEKDPLYTVNMRYWHDNNNTEYASTGTCLVGLAGAWLSKSCGAEVDTFICPTMLPRRAENAMLAINACRIGQIDDAVALFYGAEECYRVPREYKDFDVTRYSQNPVDFKKEMRELVNFLRCWGL